MLRAGTALYSSVNLLQCLAQCVHHEIAIELNYFKYCFLTQFYLHLITCHEFEWYVMEYSGIDHSNIRNLGS